MSHFHQLQTTTNPSPLRRTGKAASSLKASFTVAGGTVTGSLPLSFLSPSGEPPRRHRIPDAAHEWDTNTSSIELPRSDGLRDRRFPTDIDFWTYCIPMPSYSHAYTGRPSFHIPGLHSLGSNYASTVLSDTQGDNGRPVRLTMTAQVARAGEPQQDVVPTTPHNLMRTPTASSNVSSESQYTNQSTLVTMLRSRTWVQTAGMGTRWVTISPLTQGGRTLIGKTRMQFSDLDSTLSKCWQIQSIDHRTPYEQSPTTP